MENYKNVTMENYKNVTTDSYQNVTISTTQTTNTSEIFNLTQSTRWAESTVIPSDNWTTPNDITLPDIWTTLIDTTLPEIWTTTKPLLSTATTDLFTFNTTTEVTNATMVTYYLCGNDTNNTPADYSYLMASFVYVCLLLIIGIPGNALVIYVYLFKWPKSTSRIFILALASYDMINCACSMPFELALLLNFNHFDHPVLCKVSRFLTGLINNTTTFLLIVIAVDRFKRICRPHNRHITPALGKKLVLIGTVFGLCTNWPMLILYGTMTIPGGKTCLIEDKMLHTRFPMIFILFLLLGHFITDCILITLYAFVGKVIFNRRHVLKSSSSKLPKSEVSASSYTVDELDSNEQEQKRSRMASFLIWNRVSDEFRKRSNTTGSISTGKKHISQKKKISLFRRALSRVTSDKENGRNLRAGKTTLMLFLVTVVFILSFIPHTSMVILRYANPKFVLCLPFIGKSIYQLTLRSYLLNSVLNPIVYCFVSNQFRSKCKMAVRHILCCSTSPDHSRTISDGHSDHT